MKLLVLKTEKLASKIGEDEHESLLVDSIPFLQMKHKVHHNAERMQTRRTMYHDALGYHNAFAAE